MTYEFWKQSLAGAKPKMFVDDPQLGFYRRGVYEKQENKARKRVGWEPVAIFLSDVDERINAMVGSKHETDRDRINELWSYCAAYPISEEWYRAVAEEGKPWPDSHEEKPELKPLYVSGEIKPSDAAFANGQMVPEGQIGLSPAQQALGMQERPESKIAREIAECEKQLAKYATIDSDEMSSKARSLQQRFLDLRSEAKKNYEAANRPLLDQQKALRAVWTPLQEAADTASVALRAAMGRWEDTKRESARRAQVLADARQREHEEAARKAAEANQPAPEPPPEPVKPNTPPPATQIRGGAGRAATVRVEVVVTDIDVMKVAEQFKDSPALKEFLIAMAQKAIRAGIGVPGATTEEKSSVR